MPRRRRRLLAFSAAFALGGGLLFAPVLATQTASAIGGLTIIAPFNGDFPVHSPTFSMNGFAPAGDPLTFLLDGGPHPCSGISPIANGFGGWDWFCSVSGPTVPLPGAHTLEVYQIDGVVEDTVNFTVISPTPNVNGIPLSAERDDPAFAIGGQGTYYGPPITASNVHVEVVGYPAAGCVTPVNPLSFWSCSLNLAGIPPGDNFSLNVWQEDDAVVGVVGAQFLDITPPRPVIDTVPAGTTNTTASTITVGGPYDFGSLGASMGGDVTVTVSDPNGIETAYCATFATGHYDYTDATWTCPIPLAFGTSEVWVRVVETSSDLSSPASSSIFITRPAPPAPPAAPAHPHQGTAPWTWSFTVSGPDDGMFRPGDHVTFHGAGVPTGSGVTIELHSTPITLGSAMAGGDGTFAFEATLPSDVEPGAHHFVVTATPPGQAASVLQEAVEIQLPLVGLEEDPEAEADPEVTASTEGGSGGGGSGARSDPAAPSILTGSLATLGHILDNPFVLVLSGGLAIALLFLVAFPTELLNSTLSANTGRLGRGFVAIESRVERIKIWFLRVTRSRALASGILVLVLSVIYGFTDPSFGWDLVSLRLVLSLGIAMFILTYLVGWVTGLLGRVAWGVHSQVEFQPAIAVFAVVGVVLARILEFAPGFFVGVVIGLELIRPGRIAAARVTLVQFALVVAVAIGAWLGYSALASGGVADDFGGALLGDTLVALTAEGLTAAAIAILPLRFLEGRDLYAESKPIWLATFLIVEFAFTLIVLPTALQGTEIGDVGVWAIVFLVFGIATLALWGMFARLDRRRELELERSSAEHDKVAG